MKIITKNKKASFNYEVLEKIEAGIVLKGSEVKSIRENKINIDDAYARFIKGELYLINANIPEYSKKSVFSHDPKASRKLLLHKNEIKRLIGKTKEKGLTLIPLNVYFNNKNRVKIEIGLAKGKKVHDKREDIKRKDLEREFKREFKNLIR
ncbi:MAG TPA: SsrA-binding protein SmpB [Spirochaetota bacterium]|nr:SsrA-binding protein SmpB [Spirochaetota bacterium]HOM39087.1 SsrA-binding protein SmpB [Spirochaetota bacterium]HPQ49993.1 SsrA-binding protein SmpB [Spirochaetota bacterium]